ncbi:MAG: glycosyltransferase family 4 protein [Muribaculaceae bacterium]
MIKTKGIFELLEACSKQDGIKLKIVGLATEHIRKEVYKIYGNADWFEICGEMEYVDVIKEMIKCDIFVLPTYTEGFPNVILEAMAVGCAIITTPVGAIPQMLEDDEFGKYGVFVEPKNAYALHSAISSLLCDENGKTEMRKNTKLRVNKRYNINAIWQQLLLLWQD